MPVVVVAVLIRYTAHIYIYIYIYIIRVRHDPNQSTTPKGIFLHENIVIRSTARSSYGSNRYYNPDFNAYIIPVYTLTSVSMSPNGTLLHFVAVN